MIRIKILNWEKHQERRSDKYKNSWFKLRHDFLRSDEAFQLTHGGRIAWLALLSEASSQNRPVIELNLRRFGAVYDLKVCQLKLYFKKFNDFGWIEEFRDTNGTRPLHVDQEQNKTEVTYSPLGMDCPSSDSERESSSGRDHPTSPSPGSSEASSCKQLPQSTPPIGRRPPTGSRARKSLQVDFESELVPSHQSSENLVTTGELTTLWSESAKGVTPKVRSDIDSLKQDYLGQLYQAYPRKLGKAAGIKKLESLMKGKTSDEKKKLVSEILRGIERYSESVRGEESKYTLYFSTFINQERWKDYQVDEINKSNVNEANAEPLFGLPGLNDD